MTNKEILQIAMQQSAEDIGCNASDFLADDNRVVPFKLGEKSKNYYKLPIGCNFISYGNNVVAAATDEISGIAKEYVSKFKFYHCFETPNMRWLNERLEPLGMTACFMAEYYLPDLERLPLIAWIGVSLRYSSRGASFMHSSMICLPSGSSSGTRNS